MRVLVTGAAGFAGHHFVQHALEATDWEIIGLYSLRHRGCSLRLPAKSHRFTPIFHDLRGPLSVRVAGAIGLVDHIVNMAAESHVERSIREPVPFVQNNIDVALNMLEYARNYGRGVATFFQISTDEVYGPAVEGDLHEEWREFVPSNPYAASKVAQEALAISYWRTYGVPVVITNTMNMCGPGQDPEKFVPMCIKKILNGEVVQIHGSENGGIGSRQYLHAKNHADALIYLMTKYPPTRYKPDLTHIYQKPDRYNIVGAAEVNNLEMAQMIAKALGKELKYELVDFHGARPGHDRRYALDGTKISKLGWKPPFSLEQTIQETVDFSLKNPNWLMEE